MILEIFRAKLPSSILASTTPTTSAISFAAGLTEKIDIMQFERKFGSSPEGFCLAIRS
jgi:hypothetical protein